MKTLKICSILLTSAVILSSCNKDYRYSDNASDQAANANALSGTEWKSESGIFQKLVNNIVVEESAKLYTEQTAFVLSFSDDVAVVYSAIGDTAGVYNYQFKGGNTFLIQNTITPSQIDSSFVAVNPIEIQLSGSLLTSISVETGASQQDTSGTALNIKRVRKSLFQRMR